MLSTSVRSTLPVVLCSAAIVLKAVSTPLKPVPLMIVMVFAVILARLGEITTLEEFFGNEEVAYFVLFAWLGAAGPGPVSLDLPCWHYEGRVVWGLTHGMIRGFLDLLQRSEAR